MKQLAPRELASRWAALRDARPLVEPRDAAAQLGVSEAELVATELGRTAVQLAPAPASLLHALVEVGTCRAITRNDVARCDVRGIYSGIEIDAHAGTVTGDRIDLRLLVDHWATVLALDEPHPARAGARRRSIRVFDRFGDSVHDIVLEPDGDAANWDAIVATRTVEVPLATTARPGPRVEKPDATVERDILHADLDAISDTHELFEVLATHGISRTQALRLAGESRARAVRNDSIEHVLFDAAETGAEIAMSVGNRGCVQVFTGEVGRVSRRGACLEIGGPDLAFQLRVDRVYSTWVVAKATRLGTMHALELYDGSGEPIAIVHRPTADPGAWRHTLDRLPDAPRRPVFA